MEMTGHLSKLYDHFILIHVRQPGRRRHKTKWLDVARVQFITKNGIDIRYQSMIIFRMQYYVYEIFVDALIVEFSHRGGY